MKDAFLLYESEISDSKAQVRCLTAIVGSLLNCRHFTVEDYEALITKAAQYANKLLKKPDQSRMITLCAHLFSSPGGSTSEVRSDSIEISTTALAEGDAVTRYCDPDRVLECMQRALKVASVSNPNIFVEILDRYHLSEVELPITFQQSPLINDFSFSKLLFSIPVLFDFQYSSVRYIYFFEKNNPVIKVAYLSGLVALINEQLEGEGAKEGQSGAVEVHFRNTLGSYRLYYVLFISPTAEIIC